MRGTWRLTAAVLVAIGLGIAVESAGKFGPPSAVAAAINRTIAVSGVEAAVEPVPLRKGDPVLTFIYNAPDRFEASAPAQTQASGTADPTVIDGNKEYVPGPAYTSRATVYLELPSANRVQPGLNQAQAGEFGQLLDVRNGADFQRTSGGYSFRLFTHDIFTPPRPKNLPPGTHFEPETVDTWLVGGSVTLHAGYVRRVVISTLVNGVPRVSEVTYSDFDTAPVVRPPTHFQPCSTVYAASAGGQFCDVLSQQKAGG